MSTLKTDKLYSTDRSTGSDENILLNDDGTTNLKGNTTVTGTCTATTFSGSGASLTNVPDSALSTVTASKLTGALPAISGASLTGITSNPPSFRNLVYNGQMMINQRGTEVNAGNQYGGPDRWFFMKNDGGMTVSQDTDVPTGQGFGNSYKVDVTTAAGTAGVNYVALQQRFEGQDLLRIKKGTANAESLTLSFWIKSTKQGTYIAELYDTDNNRCVSKSYTVTDSNTWEKKTVTFPADTTGAFNNDNAESLRLYLWMFAGSHYQGGTLSTSWASETAANRAEGQVNACDHADNNIYFTGIQLEVGTSATDFEFRTYGDELQKCLRYFWMIKGDNYDKPGISTFANNASTCRAQVKFPVPMRAGPTFEGSTTSMMHDSANDSDNFNINTFSLSAGNITTEACPSGCTIEVSTASMDSGAAGDLEFKENGGFMKFKAEL